MNIIISYFVTNDYVLGYILCAYYTTLCFY